MYESSILIEFLYSWRVYLILLKIGTKIISASLLYYNFFILYFKKRKKNIYNNNIFKKNFLVGGT